ncbi:protease modulator HflC [Ramlibacter rhizophilus]|uniref:Protein HflC n=1 Tax=Ramlibacter rhizophilus TaxID=1781167 RepID=A0A4Z0BWX8_9BURK|nr:protease modulator HflC [Ramlibacter rhizophilus]TFZ03212.1 protease modulator HflC [Ramlibacter rhizophilus]
MNRLGIIIAALLVVLAVASSMLFVVDQRQFGVVYALGQIKQVITEPGLHFKLPPPFQNVRYIDKRLLTMDSADAEPMLTAEKQRVVIDWFVRWRITDPLQYIRNVGLDEQAGAVQLNRVVRNAFQEEINRRTVSELLSTRRDELMADVKREAQEVVKGNNPWGVDVVDVRITRADYVDAITESVYRRMEAERKRVANELRSTGAAEGEKIRAEADRQREVTIANAYREAQKVKGEGDAQAAAVYNEAFGRDPQFAQFYRSLEAYKSSIGKRGDVLVLDPSTSEFFRTFRGGGGSGGASAATPAPPAAAAAAAGTSAPRR